MGKYYSTKTYGTDRGLSCCFRQWRASHSHCSTLHGYSIGIKLIFESETLDEKTWVMDFGGLKAFKDWSEWLFDHTLVVAEDDPNLDDFIRLSKIESRETMSPLAYERGALCDIRIVPSVGCESFAKQAYDVMNLILQRFKEGNSFTIAGKEYMPRYPVGKGVSLKSVEVFEHAGNSAIYEG